MRILQKSVHLADPHMCSDSTDRLNILGAMFDALVGRDGAGKFMPALARQWQVEADARTWTFRLRADAVFHDGQCLHAGDVKASLERACDPEVGGELGTEGVWASYLGDAEVVVSDPATVRVVTARPMADLLQLLVDIPILPRSGLSQLPGCFVGTGPYRMLEYDDEHAVLEAFDECVLRRPGDAVLDWRAELDEKRRVEALAKDEADLIALASRSNADAVSALGARVLAHESNLCVAFLFNASNGPGANAMLRQAVNHAVDVRRMIAQALGGAGSPLNGPLTALHFGCDTSLEPYTHDPRRARALLAKSGAASRLVVDLPTSLPDEAPLLGALMAEDLEAVGIQVELRQFEDRSAYAQRVKAKAIDDLCCFDSSPLSTYRVLREKLDSSVAGPWWQGYHNPHVNELLQTASRTTDDEQRRQVYHRAYRLIHDDAPWLFLYRPTKFWGASVRAGDTWVGPDGLLRLDDAAGCR